MDKEIKKEFEIIHFYSLLNYLMILSILSMFMQTILKKILLLLILFASIYLVGNLIYKNYKIVER